MYESPGSVPNHLPWSLARRANVNTNEVNDNKKDCVATRGQMPTEKDHIIVGQSSADSKSKKEQGIFRRIFCSCI